MRVHSGQALIELLLVFSISIVIILTATKILTSEWENWKCSRNLFEAIHAARIENPAAQSIHPFLEHAQIEETPYSFRGRLRCGTRTHEIELPKVNF